MIKIRNYWKKIRRKFPVYNSIYSELDDFLSIETIYTDHNGDFIEIFITKEKGVYFIDDDELCSSEYALLSSTLRNYIVEKSFEELGKKGYLTHTGVSVKMETTLENAVDDIEVFASTIQKVTQNLKEDLKDALRNPGGK